MNRRRPLLAASTALFLAAGLLAAQTERTPRLRPAEAVASERGLPERLATGAPAGWTLVAPQGTGGACIVTCPADVVVSNDAGQCSALVDPPVPTTQGNCGFIACAPSGISPRGAPSHLLGGPSDCCYPNGSVGCSEPVCEAAVCGNDSFCCSVEWDSICASAAADLCAQCGGPADYPVGTTPILCEEIVPQGDATGGVSNCCFANGSPGCDDPTCETTVCGIDSFCCNVAWDSICADLAVDNCSVCAGLNDCSFNVIVNDTEAPALQLPGDQVVGTDAPDCAATVGYAAGATDNCPGVSFSCAPPAGSLFPLGTTPVGCTALDAAGNGAGGGFDVTVVDDDPPALVCPADLFAVAPPGALSVPVDFTEPTPTDNCPGPTAGCAPAPGDPFPLGETAVACTALDGAGNSADCAFDVTVGSQSIQEIPTASSLGLAALALLLLGAGLWTLRRTL